MAKRRKNLEEVLGPAVDGLEHFEFPPPQTAPVYGEDPEEEEQAEAASPPLMLAVGGGELARKTSELAFQCGFEVEAVTSGEEQRDEVWDGASIVHVAPDYADVVEACGIGKGACVCIFEEDPELCEDLLRQCLSSEASYLGLVADQEKKKKVFSALREHGEPDAELATVHCPMGLNVGAQTDEQAAVGIVAELLASNAGTLNRLLFE